MEQLERTAVKSLGEILTKNAQEVPDRIAVVDRSCRLAWSEIEQRTNRLANGLSDRGVKKGDRIAFLLQNSHPWIEVTFAALKLGAVLVPLNYRMTATELEGVLEGCSPSALIFSDSFLGLCQSLSIHSGETSTVIRIGPPGREDLTYEEFLAESDPEAPRAGVSEDDLACISFTSGTTGFPKGVMWTHQTLLATVSDNPFPAELCRHSRQLVLAPTFLAGALTQILNGACNAATLILRDFDPAEVLRTIEKEKPTLMACAAVMLRMLASLPEANECDTSSLDRIYYGGASIGSYEAYQEIRKLFTCDLQQGYGSAETCILISRLDPAEHENLETEERRKRLRSAGRVAAGAQVKLVGQDGQTVTQAGEVGEVAVKAPWVMKGYWNRPQETSQSFDREGYYLTGDMGTWDREGYLFLVERKDDMIKTGGLNVYPSEVEGVLASHPAVEEVAVIGIPHPKWETAVAAVVRTKPGRGVTDEDLRTFSKEKIASYKIPKAFFPTENPLPRSPLGKVQRNLLRESFVAQASVPRKAEAKDKPDRPPPRDDPLRHCRRCEFQEVCEKFCYKYFE